MKINKLLSRLIPATAVLLAIALVVLVSPVTVMASNMMNGESTVEFTAGGTNPGTTGGLELDAVPKFTFGTGTISSSEKRYNSQASATEGFLKVRDESGTDQGWQVRATMTKFTSGSTELTGIRLYILPNGSTAITQRNDTGTVYGTNTKPTMPATIELITGSTTATAVLTAARNAGQGLYWADLKAELLVPGGTARKGSFKATITWSLVSGV